VESVLGNFVNSRVPVSTVQDSSAWTRFKTATALLPDSNEKPRCKMHTCHETCTISHPPPSPLGWLSLPWARIYTTCTSNSPATNTATDITTIHSLRLQQHTRLELHYIRKCPSAKGNSFQISTPDISTANFWMCATHSALTQCFASCHA
jgi:hypothetical protein